MAEYTSRHTGLQIDEALDSALNVKQVRGIVKMTDAGPVAAVPGEDFPADSGSTMSVTGLLKGVLNAETGEIEIQQAAAGTDYQTPLTAGADYAIPSAVANKQNKITAQGLLKGLGDGSVAAAEAGVDYQAPIPAGTYATPDNVSAVVSSHNSNDSAHSAQFGNKQDNITVSGMLKGTGESVVAAQRGVDYVHPDDVGDLVGPATATALPASGTALTANTIYAVADAVGTYAFTPPATGWAHGKFTTGSSVSVSFAGTFLGTAPTIEASKTYEFDVYNGVWAVQEVVSA